MKTSRTKSEEAKYYDELCAIYIDMLPSGYVEENGKVYLFPEMILCDHIIPLVVIDHAFNTSKLRLGGRNKEG
jgi:hypothetical protein